MNMFSNLSSQASGIGSSLGSWFKKEGKENENGQGTESTEGGQTIPSVQDDPSPASANISDKSIKGSADEDASSQHSGATESADSNPPSEPEDENADGKAGFASGLGFNLQGVSTRASAGAKTVGSFFSSAFSKAGASVKEAGSKIKETVEKNTLLSEFNKEQEAFIAAKGGTPGQALAPWVGYPQEEALKEEILALSTDRRNFVRSPPTGVSFEFELEQFLPVAEATLAADPNLQKMRFELVPKTINEETFWRNYFYRVGLIRQSTELSSLEKEQPAEANAEASACTAADKTKGEADWEAELREELGEYEVVEGGEGGNKDGERWEEEIQNMIDEEEDDSTGDLR